MPTFLFYLIVFRLALALESGFDWEKDISLGAMRHSKERVFSIEGPFLAFGLYSTAF